ncbi:uncharacterized protein L201_003401 [Kwoniella dendrophila CBS 6074]|uniref:Uncharacterized protein n=1 Tax=Kwoniella dendrophila CBS 6074 TaxID=1295534 RepID=A0AAX4JV89_9TREE
MVIPTVFSSPISSGNDKLIIRDTVRSGSPKLSNTFSSVQLTRRDDDDDEKPLWENSTPKANDIKQGKNNDWFLCALSSIVNKNKDDIKSKIDDSEKNENGEKIVKVKLFNMNKQDWQTKDITYGDIDKKKNGNSGDIWWPSVFEEAAQEIEGTGFIENHEFLKDGTGDIGLRMISGIQSETLTLDEDVDNTETRAKLWNVLKISNTSPMCIKKDNRWYGLLGTQDQQGSDVGRVTLYDVKKGKEENLNFNEIKDKLSHYSKFIQV